jgi:hypothetical protein
MSTVTWEFLTISITYDGGKRRDWVVEYRERAPLVGFQAILDAYSSRGWELMALNPERLRAVVGFGQYHIEPQSYRATFRRPVENPD